VTYGNLVLPPALNRRIARKECRLVSVGEQAHVTHVWPGVRFQHLELPPAPLCHAPPPAPKPRAMSAILSRHSCAPESWRRFLRTMASFPPVWVAVLRECSGSG